MHLLVEQFLIQYEVELLRQRFAPLEASLDSDVEMPADFGVDEFVTSWGQHK